MPGLLAALQQGLNFAASQQQYLANIPLQREQILNAYRQDQANNFFNSQVSSGIDPLRAQFQLSRQPFGINQSQRALAGGILGTQASAPLATAAAFSGNSYPAAGLLSGYTGNTVNPGGINLAVLQALSGQTGGAIGTQGNANIYSALGYGGNPLSLGAQPGGYRYGQYSGNIYDATGPQQSRAVKPVRSTTSGSNYATSVGRPF